MRRITSIFLRNVVAVPLVLFALLIGYAPAANAAGTVTYNPSYLISDQLFTDSSSMGVTQIQNFLLKENSGLASYHDTEDCSSNPTYMAQYYSCGKSVLAAQIIYDASHAYSINPRSIMATLQKEQSLITTPDPVSSQLNCAMGYNSCSGVVGFFNQVDWGTWQFRTYIETMNGVSSWNGLSWSEGYACGSATSLYSTGLYPGRTVTFANPHYSGDPYSTSKPRTVTLANSSTAALYCYTPYVGPYVDTDGYSGTGYSGSFNFVVNFEQWFGSVASLCYNDTNLTDDASGREFLAYHYTSSGSDKLTLTRMNNTGSACAEAYLWNYGYTSWYAQMATAMPATNPNSGTLLTANLNGKNKPATLIYMKYGNVQVHEFSSDLKKFLGTYDVPVNLSGVSASNGTFIAGDFLGKGYDQVLYLKYKNGSGNLEIHMFSKDLRKATGTYDVVNSLTGVSSSSGVFVAGDFLHKGYDQLAYVKYSNGDKPVEVHIFSKDLRKATGTYDVATGLTGATAATGTFVAGNFGGHGDQLVYVKYSDASHHVEIHTFSSSLRSVRGTMDVITNMSGMKPPL
ncbi:MAG TPA: hypothetical protein VHD84_03420 [Candidatus Saccharimonadales bacterium]|nr:hypothetical protein [Candidatus Saccharimonadales bacterium]